ncbi:MAG: polymer-forming cytoskeletal protein [Vallitaleaceae bacterium]|jgi:cytoskeletal protein CcmA (bactofilin family)|nr:polymer-forming cytoskeletal protein [Vallitaleaceae bacterium]
MAKPTEKPSYDKPLTLIGEDTIIETSKLKSKSSVQIAGKFIGDIEVDASLVIGQGGKVEGNVLASFILVAGEVVGNLEVTQQIHLTKTAKVVGNINCQSIVIDEGASLEGQCMMKQGSNDKLKNKTV